MSRTIFIGFILISFQLIGSPHITKQRLDSLVEAVETERLEKLEKAQKIIDNIEKNIEEDSRNERYQTRNIPHPGPNPYNALGDPFSSTNYMNPILSAIISISFLLFALYVFIRVRRSLKKDK